MTVLATLLMSIASAATCGDTLTVDTTLTADVVCPPGFAGDALTIGADNITLDGNGFAIVMDGAVVEDEVIIAAGAVVTPGKRLESGYVYAGNPAKALRPLKEKERAFFPYTAGNYVKLKDQFLMEAAEAR